MKGNKDTKKILKCIIVVLLVVSVWLIIWDNDLRISENIPSFVLTLFYHGENGTLKRELVSIFSKLGIAYIASLVFYIITVHLPRLIEKENELSKYCNELDNIRKMMYKFNAYVGWISSDDYVKVNNKLSVLNSNNRVFFEERENNMRQTNFYLENGYVHLVKISESIIKDSVKLKNKLQFSQDLINLLNEISCCIVFNMFTFHPSLDNYYREIDKYWAYKYKIDIEAYIIRVQKIYKFKEYKCEYISSNLERYRERARIWVFRVKAYMMIDNITYISKSLDEIEVLYSTNLIEKENIELANDQLVEYIKLYDYDNKKTKHYIKRINSFAKVLLKSLNENKYDKYNIYYYNILQFFKRIDKTAYDSLMSSYKISERLTSFDKFFIYVLNNDRVNGEKVSKFLTIDENALILNNPIINLYKDL